jgi:2-polyprenyl-3-methyl-5-hydroxy-6-metoxy-1,4-benzoquinol methylase
MEGAEKYHRQVDPEGQSSVAQLLRWIKPGSTVLEMGPATGIMTQFLKESKGCDVTCVEVDPKAAEHAKQFCSKMIVGDLNRTEWAQELQGEAFDYIIFADVLEHLLNPADSLQHTLEYLKPDGEVLISVPNIGYIGVIAELLEGRFDYRRDGLLDETHVHFFTRKSLVQLLGQAGLVSAEWGRTTIAPEFSEFKLQTNQLGAATRGVLSGVPDGDTYQFLVRCSRTGIAALPVTPQSREFGRLALSAQVYFDRGAGFSEGDSHVITLQESRGIQTVECVCPAGVRAIRFDPVDSFMPIVLHSIRVKYADSNLFRWTAKDGHLSKVSGLLNVVEAHVLDRSVLMPLTNDPVVTVLVDCPHGATFTAELSFDAADSTKLLERESQAFRDEVNRLGARTQYLESELDKSGSHVTQLLVEKQAQEKALQSYKDALGHALHSKRDIEHVLNSLISSKSWKLTRPLRVGVRVVRALRRYSVRFIKRRTKGVLFRSKRAANSRIGGLVWHRLKLGSEYELRVLQCEPSARTLASMRAESLSSKGPLFSVVMPTYKTNPRWLKEAIESVRQQAYPFWELCIADDASDDPAVRSVLSTYAACDPRIKVAFLEENGHISASSNHALELASGDYVILLDHDDVLAPHALYRVAQTIRADPSIDVVYSDEDKMSLAGVRSEPTCKPSWSPEYFLSFMYTGHISCFRTTLVRSVGGFRLGFEGSQDYDLMLRVTERTERIVHIPEVLYHWRVHEQSVAGNLESKPYAFTAAKKALVEALNRRGFISATVDDSRARGLYIAHRGQKIPLRGTVAIGACQEMTKGVDCKVVTCERGQLSSLVATLRSLAGDGAGAILLACDSSLSGTVIDRLRDHCSDPASGVVAPLVVDANRKVVAAGLSFVEGRVHQNFRGLSEEQIGYRGRLVIPSNVSLVHPACLLFRAQLLNDIPESLETVGELVTAICLAAQKQKLRCMVDPLSVVVHDGVFADLDVPAERFKALGALCGVDVKSDPFLPAGLPRYVGCSEMPAV